MLVLLATLAGGVGAAKFLEGLIRIIPQRKIAIIGNVGDDIELYGLHISPDLDILAYTLAGLVNPKKGWGFRGDTFQCQHMLERYGYNSWFNLGDRDFAAHIFRTEELRKGRPLSEVTQDIIKRLGLKVWLLPATDDRLRTYVRTSARTMHFQEYMVKLQTAPRVSGVSFRGARKARPAKQVLEAISRAEGVIVAPSNPIVSIGAILAVRGIRDALRLTKRKIVGISPIIGGRTVKGPADKMMKALDVKPSALGVAEFYSDFLDTLVLDKVDEELAPRIEKLGIKAVVTNTLMKTLRDKTRLARVVVRELED